MDCQQNAIADLKVRIPADRRSRFIFCSGSLQKPTALEATVLRCLKGVKDLEMSTWYKNQTNQRWWCAIESRTSVRCSHVWLGTKSGNVALTDWSSCNMLQPIAIGTWKPSCMREWSPLWLCKCHGIFDVSFWRFHVYKENKQQIHTQKPWLANSCKGHRFTSLQTDMNIGSKINWIYEYRSRPAKLPQCHSCFELHSLQTRISSGETPLAGRCRRKDFFQESAFANYELTIHLSRLPHFCHTLHQGVGFVILCLAQSHEPSGKLNIVL